jgi:TPR repeat protein
MAIAAGMLNGRVVPPDFGEARHRCEQAAKYGRADAAFCLGYLYQEGLGVQKNPKEATKWYSLAATGGNRRAIQALAQIYVTGENGKVNRPAAMLLYLPQLLSGDRDALKQAAAIRSQMSQKEWEEFGKQLRHYFYTCPDKGRTCTLDAKKLDEILRQAGTH